MKKNIKSAKIDKKAAMIAANADAANRKEDAQELKEQILVKVLIEAEQDGTARQVLQGFGDAMRKMRSRAEADYSSNAAATVRAGRRAISAYVCSLLSGMDARTKTEVVEPLLYDLWHSTKHPNKAEDAEMPRRGEYDERAIMGILSVLRIISYLCFDLVREYDVAADEFAFFTCKFVEELTALVKERPELVKKVAESRIDWPIMATRHYPKESDFAKLADRIELARKSPVRPSKRHTWKPDTSINRTILQSVVDESHGDGRPLTKANVPYYLDEVLLPLFEEWAKEDGGWENCPEFAEIARSAAKRGKAGVQRSEIRNRVKRALEALAS